MTLKSGLQVVKVIETDAIRKLACCFLFAFYNHGRICSRLRYLASEWWDLENRVRVLSRSPEMPPLDRSHTCSYSPS